MRDTVRGGGEEGVDAGCVYSDVVFRREFGSFPWRGTFQRKNLDPRGIIIPSYFLSLASSRFTRVPCLIFVPRLKHVHDSCF